MRKWFMVMATASLMLGGCDTYTMPLGASYERSNFDGRPVDHVDYRLRLSVPDRYEDMLSRHLDGTVATIFECGSGVDFARVEDFTQEPGGDFQGSFRVKYTTPMNRMCVRVAGGGAFEKFETLSTKLEPQSLLY